MKLTIVISTYNRTRDLGRALESVVRQTASPALWECVVVNNNSTDTTTADFAAFAAAHPDFRLRMVHEPKQGLSNARNCGVAAAQGEYIAIVDDDETLEASFVESYIAFFDAHPAVMAAGGAVVPIYESRRPRWMSHYTERMIANPIDLGRTACRFPSHRVPAGGNMCFRREVFERVGGFNPALGRNGKSLSGGEENDLFARLRAAGCELWFVPQAAIYHHIPDAKLTDEYFDRLSVNVGRSQRLRAEFGDSLAALRRVERIKCVVAWALALGYTLLGSLAKAKYLLRMRRGISKAIFE